MWEFNASVYVVFLFRSQHNFMAFRGKGARRIVLARLIVGSAFTIRRGIAVACTVSA